MAESGRRTGFGPAMLVGLATAALTAAASGKPWFRADVEYKLVAGVADPDKTADMPLALALSLVVLAGWGALLVTRGHVRRALAGIALLAAIGVTASVAVAPFTLPDQIRDNLPGGSADVSVSPTGWYVTTAIAAAMSIAVLVVAWVRIPSWPTMGSRYDAPATRSPQDETDLWQALDQGLDPTDPAGPAAK